MGAAETTGCATLDRRIAHDKSQGRTTSQATRDFVRRTCRCAACAAWRRDQQIAPLAARIAR